ncbi:MAG TPA: hypothetical protein VGK59_10950 [Ohtaekwangia sp.]
MPILKLTNLATYKAYCADIAAKHKDIDGYKWGDENVITNDSRSDLPKRFLWAMPYDQAKYGDKHSDNVMRSKVARVAYMINPQDGKFSTLEAAYEFCEAVVEQIFARVLQDKRGKMVAIVDPPGEEWQMIVTDINSWKTGPVEKTFGSTKYVGCELEMTFMENTNLAFDASKWND